MDECGLSIFKSGLSVSACPSLMILREGSQLCSHKLITGLKALVQIMAKKMNILWQVWFKLYKAEEEIQNSNSCSGCCLSSGW